jgi:hypothetical protein
MIDVRKVRMKLLKRAYICLIVQVGQSFTYRSLITFIRTFRTSIIWNFPVNKTTVIFRSVANPGTGVRNCTGGAIFYVQKPNNRCTAGIQGASLGFPSVNQPSYQVVVVLWLVPLVLLLVVRVCLVHPARLVRLLEEWTKEYCSRSYRCNQR